MEQPLLFLPEERSKQLLGLIDKSHTSYMDLNSIVPWENGIDRALKGKRDDHSWIYGTEYWDRLTPEQRHELCWVENAQTVSFFIWLEEGLNPLFIRLLHKSGNRIPEHIREYMMIFCKEEIVHTQMFRRYLRNAKLPLFTRPAVMAFIEELVNMHPVAGVLCTYLVEGLAEEAAMRQQGPGVDPVTTKMYYEHHVEEARHLAFGKWICESFFAMAPPEAKEQLGYLVRAYMSVLVPLFTYNPEISQYLSFDIGIDPNDAETIARVQRSEHNRKVNDERYGGMLAWIKKLGVAPPEYSWYDPVVLPPGFKMPGSQQPQPEPAMA
jgi:P-aminobenzoate N-oxygenase AurF